MLLVRICYILVLRLLENVKNSLLDDITNGYLQNFGISEGLRCMEVMRYEEKSI